MPFDTIPRPNAEQFSSDSSYRQYLNTVILLLINVLFDLVQLLLVDLII